MNLPVLRAGRLVALPLVLAGALWAEQAQTQPSAAADAGTRPSGQPGLRLSPPNELHVGQHARLELELLLPSDAAGPLLITPFREGEALEVVKGRLLRSDARDPSERPLRFELPVLARAPGVARVGVHLLAYVCDASKRCRAIEADARTDVVVLP